MAYESVVLHTVEANFVHQYSPAMDQPYRRLVGVGRNSGYVACRNTSGRTIQEETLVLPSVLANNLDAFVSEHLAGFDPEEAQPDKTAATLKYQCYAFAQYMHGMRPTGEEAKAVIGQLGPAAPRVSLRHGLDVGEHGLLVSSYTGQLLHSMVGLGGGRTIQAMDVNSNVGIAPQKDISGYYDALGFEPWLYVIGQLPDRQPMPV